MATPKPRDPIGQILVERGVLTPAQTADALAEQARTGAGLGESLVERGLISRQDLGAALAWQRGAQFYDLATNPPDSQIAAMLPEWAAWRYRTR
jgi:type IV pilus assembly protein PilB